MPRNIALTLLLTFTAVAATDTWQKVRDLPGGTELRVYKKDARQPVNAKLADATEDSLIVVLKKDEEVGIPKDQIDRIDYRPQKESRVTTSGSTKVDDPNMQAPVGPQRDAKVPGTSSSSNMSFGGKPDFETIYRRPPMLPEKK
jgi:hypothetical protein